MSLAGRQPMRGVLPGSRRLQPACPALLAILGDIVAPPPGAIQCEILNSADVIAPMTPSTQPPVLHHFAGPKRAGAHCGHRSAVDRNSVPVMKEQSASAMKPEPQHHLRLAHPTHGIEAAIRFWVDGVGLTLQGRQEDGPPGHKLAFIGWPGAAWHLETVEDHTLPPSPTAEDLLVIYLGGPIGEDAISRIENAGGARVPSRNPYGDRHGMSFADADGYLLVPAARDWP